MGNFWQYLFNGFIQGSLYALVALGYTMVYGIIQLINFAHGEVLMLGAFFGYCSLLKGILLIYAMPLAMLGSGIIAATIEKLAYRPIRHAGRIPALITALGVSFFFQYFGQGVVGAEPKPYPMISFNWNALNSPQ